MDKLKTLEECFKEIVVEKRKFPSEIDSLMIDSIKMCLDGVVNRLNEMEGNGKVGINDMNKESHLPDNIESFSDIQMLADYYGCLYCSLDVIRKGSWRIHFSDPSGPYKDKIKEFVRKYSSNIIGTEVVFDL